MKKKIVFYFVLCVTVFLLAFLFGAGVFGASDEVPDIQLAFQQPSYVTDKTNTLDTYICDVTKPDCKINFDLSPSFISPYKSTDFVCEISGIDATEAGKCNPNTVTFGTGTTEVVFMIKKKSDPSVYKSRTITIQKGTMPSDSGATNTGATLSGATSTSSGVTDSGSISDTGSLTNSGGSNTGSTSAGTTYSGTTSQSGASNSGILLPEIRLAFQQPTYFLDKNPENSRFVCDTTKTECRVNFNLEESFTGGFRESDYLCRISGIDPIESEKCNPNTVTISTGTINIIFRISSKTQTGSYVEKTIVVENMIGVATDSGQTASGSSQTGSVSDSGSVTNSGAVNNSGSLTNTGIIIDPGTTNTGIIIPEPKITIQSGIDATGKCTKSDCVINVTGEESFSGVKMSDYACQWSFSGATELPSLDTCNPSYVHYGFGDFTITLRIISKTDNSAFKQTTLSFANSTPVASSGGGGTTVSPVHIPIRPVAKITPQGLGENAVFSGGILFCYTSSDVCDINLTGADSIAETKSRILYTWDYGDGRVRSGSNPAAVSLPIGTRTIKLSITDEFLISSEASLEVRILPRSAMPDAALVEDIVKNDAYPLRISRIFPNPIGKDEAEWIEIEKMNDAVIDLTHCSLSDASGKKYNFGTGMLLMEKNKRYMQSITGLSLSNTKEKVLLKCADTLISRISWDAPIPEGWIIDSAGAYEYEQKVSEDTPKMEKVQAKQTKQTKKIDDVGITLRAKVLKSGGVKIYGTAFSGASLLIGVHGSGSDIQTAFSSGGAPILVAADRKYERRIQGLAAGDYVVNILWRSSEADKWNLLDASASFHVEGEPVKEDEVYNPRIVLQGKLGKNLSFSGDAISCSARKTCSINLSLDSHDKRFIYEWDFGSGPRVYGYNPKTIKFAPGKYIVSLLALNPDTGEQIRRKIDIVVKKLVTKKKTKKPKVTVVKTKKLTVKNNLTPTIPKDDFDTTRLAVYGILGGISFSTGAGVLIKKKFLLG